MQWTVVVPTKALPAAKSRLLPATPDAAAHRRLVEAVRADTLAAARAATGVARVLVVSDVDDGTGALVQARPGLNQALREAAAHAAAQWPHDGVAALVGDLPALRAEELGAALAAAATPPRGFVADSDGTGTTLLTARPGVGLDPRFGPGSAVAHGADAVRLPAGDGLRQDVDTVDDLRRAERLGLGPRTAAVLGRPAACCSP